MATILKKSSFTDEGNGRFTRKGHIEPLTDNDVLKKIDENEPVNYISTNEEAFTVESDPADKTKFVLVWVAAGSGKVQASADADLDPDETTQISGESEEFKLEEEEATHLNVVLD